MQIRLSLGFLSALTITFIILRLTNVITWSYVWVLSPMWLPFVAVIGIFILIGILYGLFRLFGN